MYKVLYVGDPHAKPSDLEEMQSLVDYICKVAKDKSVDYICLLGDQFHTHSVINLSVMAFWRKAFEQMAAVAKVYALVGNHDMSGKDSDRSHAMMLYSPDHVRVIDVPQALPWGALAIPYMSSKETFVATANDELFKDLNVLICHQTFNGSKYENGFYAEDGIDPDLLPQSLIISGHIHTPQYVYSKDGLKLKVWYPGSPRWQTLSDANVSRYIYVVEHGVSVTRTWLQQFTTSGVCRPIYLLKDTESNPVDKNSIQLNATIIVDIHGSHSYCKNRAHELEALGCRVRIHPENQRQVRIKESDGVTQALVKFLSSFKSKFSTSNQRLLELAKERISWAKGI